MERSRIDDALLCCLRAEPDAAVVRRLDSLVGTEWDAFVTASRKHGITPLVYRRLSPSGTNAVVPAGVMATLRQAYLENSARNIGLYRGLGKILERMCQKGIPVIVLKGAHLAELVYGNAALRSMSDVDLLVREADLKRVESDLLELGYAPVDYERTPSPDRKHFGYTHAKSGLYVEIHWTVLAASYDLQIDVAGLWERSRPAVIAGQTVAVLCPNDLILHLCIHAGEHAFRVGLPKLCDLCVVVQHEGADIDWTCVLSRAREWRVERCVYTALRITQELLGPIVPTEVMEAMEAIAPGDTGDVAAEYATEQVLSTSTRDDYVMPDVAARVWASARIRDIAASVLESARRVFIPRNVLARMYFVPSDSIRIYFYYALRIRDLLRRHGYAMWRLMKGDRDMRSEAKGANEAAWLKAWLMHP
jgi:hypothetical protein